MKCVCDLKSYISALHTVIACLGSVAFIATLAVIYLI